MQVSNSNFFSSPKDEKVKVVIFFGGEKESEYYYSVGFFDTKDQALSYLSTGAHFGTWVDGETVTISDFSQIEEDYFAVVADHHVSGVYKGQEFKNKNLGCFFLNGSKYDVASGPYPWKLDNPPIMPESVITVMWEEVLRFIKPHFDQYYESLESYLKPDVVKELQLEGSEGVPDHLEIPSIITRIISLHGTMYIPRGHPSCPVWYEEERDFTIGLRALQTSYRTFIFIDSIYLPKPLQGKGIFTGVLKIIKRYMDKYNLGKEIGMVDSSEGDIESGEVVEKAGLFWDPFMESRYGLAYVDKNWRAEDA